MNYILIFIVISFFSSLHGMQQKQTSLIVPKWLMATFTFRNEIAPNFPRDLNDLLLTYVLEGDWLNAYQKLRIIFELLSDSKSCLNLNYWLNHIYKRDELSFAPIVSPLEFALGRNERDGKHKYGNLINELKKRDRTTISKLCQAIKEDNEFEVRRLVLIEKICPNGFGTDKKKRYKEFPAKEAFNSSAAILRFLLKNGLRLDNEILKNSFTYLIFQYERYKRCERYERMQETSVSKKEEKRKADDCFQKIMLLLEKGVNPNRADVSTRTPLSYAESKEIIDLLKEKGAN